MIAACAMVQVPMNNVKSTLVKTAVMDAPNDNKESSVFTLPSWVHIQRC